MKNEFTVSIGCLNLANVDRLRTWRNKLKGVYRTPFLLTDDMQKDFYKNIVCNRLSRSRFYAVKSTSQGLFVGMTGLVNIEWENRICEISLTIDPEESKKGYGRDALILTLQIAFEELNINHVYGECYECNPSINFWKKMIEEFKAYNTVLPNRKYSSGQYWDSIYFDFEKGCINGYLNRDS